MLCSRVLRVLKMIRVGRVEVIMLILGLVIELHVGLRFEEALMWLQGPKMLLPKVEEEARVGQETKMVRGGRWESKTGYASTAITITSLVIGIAIAASAILMILLQGMSLGVSKHLAGSRVRTTFIRVHIRHWISSCGLLTNVGNHISSATLMGMVIF